MIKLLIRGLIFLLPIFLSVAFFEFLLRGITSDYAFKSKFLDENAGKIEVLIFGNSHASYGINPNYFDFFSFNDSHASQTIDYDQHIFFKYINKATRLKYIILPLDYFSLFKRFEDGWEANRIKYYNIYYGMWYTTKLENYLEILNNKFSYNAKRIWMFYVRKKFFRNCNDSGWATFNKEQKRNFNNNGEYRAIIHTSTNKKNLLSSIDKLQQIITVAAEKKIKVLLLTMPAHQSYIRCLNNEQIQTTVNVAEKMATNYDNVKYFNFLSNTYFTDDDFFDSDHLNEKGAKKLSIKLDSIIKHF